MNAGRPGLCQRGAASLVVALVLLLSMTLITLSVARTQLSETRMAGNEQQQYRLQLQAESVWENAAQRLVHESAALQWQPGDAVGSLVSRSTVTDTGTGLQTRMLYERADSNSPYIDLSVTVAYTGGRGPVGRISRKVRLLTVLSPLAERAPPLVLGGCLSSTGYLDIRPVHSDSDTAGDAVWRLGAPCRLPASLDLHAGRVVDRSAVDDMWRTFFSIERAEYRQLAAADGALPARQRRYWFVDTAAEPWGLSLGSVAQPVVLAFPATAGCPHFKAGVRIVGLVYIGSACNLPLADAGLEITGSLIVGGALDAGPARLRLNHIQTSDPARLRLVLPVLRTVGVPGSWRDF